MAYDTTKYICQIAVADSGLNGDLVGLDTTWLKFCDVDPNAQKEKTCVQESYTKI